MIVNMTIDGHTWGTRLAEFVVRKMVKRRNDDVQDVVPHCSTKADMVISSINRTLLMRVENKTKDKIAVGMQSPIFRRKVYNKLNNVLIKKLYYPLLENAISGKILKEYLKEKLHDTRH